MTMSTTSQQHKYLKAKVALALYCVYGHVPEEAEIERVYRLTRVLYIAVLGTQCFPKQQNKNSGQLVLF